MKGELDLYTVKMLAEEGGVSLQRVRELCAAGRLDAVKPGGRDWLIPGESARAWLKSDRKPGRPRKQVDD